MGSKDKELTQERLKEVVEYHPDRGVFTRKTSFGKLKVGDITGGVSSGNKVVRVLNKPYQANRLAFFYMNGAWPKRQLTYKDGDRLNLMWGNIEESVLAKDRGELTQDRLKELFKYDPETGHFTRIKAVKGYRTSDSLGHLSEKGYLMICIDDRDYRAHRLAFLYMEGKWPKDQVDHLNRVRNDNRWCNLRDVTNLENSKNSSIQSNNRSGHAGVCWDKSRGKWVAEIRCKIKGRKRLGRFDELGDAVAARKAAEVEFGFSEGHGSPAPGAYLNR